MHVEGNALKGPSEKFLLQGFLICLQINYSFSQEMFAENC